MTKAKGPACQTHPAGCATYIEHLQSSVPAHCSPAHMCCLLARCAARQRHRRHHRPHHGQWGEGRQCYCRLPASQPASQPALVPSGLCTACWQRHRRTCQAHASCSLSPLAADLCFPACPPSAQIYPGKVSCSWAGPAGKKQLAKAYIGKVSTAALGSCAPATLAYGSTRDVRPRLPQAPTLVSFRCALVGPHAQLGASRAHMAAGPTRASPCNPCPAHRRPLTMPRPRTS